MGVFQFRRLPMGLRNAAQSFQRMMDSIFGDLEGLFVYMDYILLFAKGEEEHYR